MPGDQSSPLSSALYCGWRETRYSTTETVEILLLDPASGPRFSGTVLDVSGSGLRVETAAPINKGVRLGIILPDGAIIFAEARHCSPSGTLYHVDVAIEVLYYARPVMANHIGENELNLYLAGKGLTVIEAIHLKNHLLTCTSCQDRLIKAQTM